MTSHPDTELELVKKGWQAHSVHSHVETEMPLRHHTGKWRGRSGDTVLDLPSVLDRSQ